MKLTLPRIPDVGGFYMTPVNATARLGAQDLADNKAQFISGADTVNKQLAYTQESNTVFYYNDYRVVLLLDFSQSATTIYPSMKKSYLEKMRESLSVITENLLFQIKNQFRGKTAGSKNHYPAAETSRKMPQFFNSTDRFNNYSRTSASDEDSDFIYNRDNVSTIDEQYESSTAPAGTPHPSQTLIDCIAAHPQPIKTTTPATGSQTTGPRSESGTNKSDHFNSQSGSDQPTRKMRPPNESQEFHKSTSYLKHKAHQKEKAKAAYTPRVYLSIIVSGIPPGNHIKIIMHNQRLDLNNLKDLLTNIEGQLVHIEQEMKNRIQLAKEVIKDQTKQQRNDIQGSLQAHLKNAQYILDLMNLDAKPLLVFFTDCTNSLFELHKRMAQHKLKNKERDWQSSGRLDASIHRLHLDDTQLISVDLAEENKVCQQFGFLNHEHELVYLTSITQGLHLTHSKLMEIKRSLDLERVSSNLMRHDDAHCTFLAKNLFEREDKVRFEINKNGALTVIDDRESKSSISQKIKQHSQEIVLRRISERSHPFGRLGKRSKDLNKIRQINSLQKIMFSRASNYKNFLQSKEIKELLGDYVVDQFRLKSDLQRQASSWQDLSISSLLLQNEIIPILESESLAEYQISNVGFASLIEFRSKLGFKYFKVDYFSKETMWKMEKSEDGHGDHSGSQRAIRSIEYRYRVNSHIFISCVLSLEPISNASSKSVQMTPANLKTDAPSDRLKPAKKHEKALSITTGGSSVGKYEGEGASKSKSTSKRSDKIYVSYDLYAPSESLKSINKEKVLFKKQQQALDSTVFKSKKEQAQARKEKAQSSLYGRLHTFINSIYDRDRHFSLLEEIVQVLRETVPELSRNEKKFNFTESRAKPIQSHEQYLKEKTEEEKLELLNIDKQRTGKEKKDKKDKKDKKERKGDRGPIGDKDNVHITKSEDPRTKLFEKKKTWEKLVKRIASHKQIQQWKCYFRYCMFTIMTQTNRASYKHDSSQSNNKSDQKWRHDVDLEKVWVQDRQIERQLFEVMRGLTSFTLNRDTFVMVFSESQKTNQYKLGDSNKRGGKKGDSGQSVGFCFIKLKWIASNIAECHIGFYQVGPQMRLDFVRKMKKDLNQQCQTITDMNRQKQQSLQVDAPCSAPFFCYSKNIPSLLMRLPQRQLEKQKKLEKFYLDNAFSADEDEVNIMATDKEAKKMRRAQRQFEEERRALEMHKKLVYKENEHSDSLAKVPLNMLLFSGVEPMKSEIVHNSLHEMWQVRFGFGKQGIEPNRTQLFHQHEWRWENVNQNTNREFFNRVLEMRLAEDFIIVNRYTGTSDYFHLVKVLRAYKDPIHLKKFKGNSSDLGTGEVQKNEKVEILVQYIMELYTEKVKVTKAQQASNAATMIRTFAEDDELINVGRQQTQEISVVKTKLFMEKEISWFPLDKTHKANQHGSALISCRGRNRRPARFASAVSRTSSLPKSRLGSQSRVSSVSKSSVQEQNTSSDSQIECRSGKDFFQRMRDYMQEIDNALRQSTCSFHQIVKNSIKQQVEQHKLQLRTQLEAPLKEELCYFKNIQASTRRLRCQLEDSIQEKMIIMHGDWSHFLEKQYPELSSRKQAEGVLLNQVDNHAYDDQSFNIKSLLGISQHIADQFLRAPQLETVHDSAEAQLLQKKINQRFLEDLKKIMDDFADADCKVLAKDFGNHSEDVYCKLLTKRHLLLIELPCQQVCAQKLEEQEAIQIKYYRFSQDMIQVPKKLYKNSPIYKYFLQMKLEKHHSAKRMQQTSRLSRPNFDLSISFKQTRSDPSILIQDTEETFDMSKFREEKKQRVFKQSDTQPLSPAEVGNQLTTLTRVNEATKANDENKDDVATAKQVLTPSPLTPVECSSEPETTPDKMPELIQAQMQSDATSKKSKDDIDFQKTETSGEDRYSLRFVDFEDYEEEFEVRQIDQQEQVRWYYDHLYRRDHQGERVQFETKVSQIARNFITYLRELFQRAFTEDVLEFLKDKQQKSTKATTAPTDNRNQPAQENQKDDIKLRQEDFRSAVNSMGYTSFRMDINFAFLVYYHLVKLHGGKVGSDSQDNKTGIPQLDLLNLAQDLIFKETIRRNFSQCTIDPNFYVYNNNQADGTAAQQAKAEGNGNKMNKPDEIFVDYHRNLQNTEDGYSDSENKSKNKNKPSESNDYKEVYKSCHLFLFEAIGVVKDASGTPIDTQPVKSIAELFATAMKHDGLVKEMIQKARAQDRRNKDRMRQFLESYGDKPVPRDSNSAETTVTGFSATNEEEKVANSEEENQVHVDSNVGIDLHFRFYTIPKYVGLIQAENADIFHDSTEDILVNDDLQEDLLRACQLFNLLDSQIPEEKIRFAPPFFQRLKKNQIIKAIPYYFAMLKEESDHQSSIDVPMDRTDCRIFWYTQIQRRIIYGILRRVYAIMAEFICEMLTMLQEQSLCSVSMIHKYVGYLIYNQRQTGEVLLFQRAEVEKFPEDQFKKMFAQELQSNKVVHNGFFRRTRVQEHLHPSYALKAQMANMNATASTAAAAKKQDKQDYDPILFHTLYYLVGTASQSQSSEQVSSHGQQRVEFELPTQWESAQRSLIKDEKKGVKFWCFFMVTRDYRLHYTFYLPRAKNAYAVLSNEIVHHKMKQMAALLSSRIQKLLQLQEINSKKSIKVTNANLEPTDHKYSEEYLEAARSLPTKSFREDDFSSAKLADKKDKDLDAMRTQDKGFIRSEMIFNQSGANSQNKPGATETATSFYESSTQKKSEPANVQSRQEASTTTATRKTKIGNFFARIEEHTKEEVSATPVETITQSQVVSQEHEFQPVPPSLTPKQSIVSERGPEQLRKTPSEMMVNSDHAELIAARGVAQSQVLHRVNSEALQSPKQSTATKIITTGGAAVSAPTAHETSQVAQETISKQEENLLPEIICDPHIQVFHDLTSTIRTTFRLNGKEAITAVSKEFENMQLGGTNDYMLAVEKEKTINLIRLTNLNKRILPGEQNEPELIGSQERLLVEVLGVDRPNIDFLLNLRDTMLKLIQQNTMEKISERRKLEPEDIDFIQKAPDKRILMFPVQRSVADQLALLQYLKQSLSRKLLQSLLDKERQELTKHLQIFKQETTNASQQTQTASANLQADEESKSPAVSTPLAFNTKYDEDVEKLLFNFRRSEDNGEVIGELVRGGQMWTKAKKGQLGDYFGRSLAILTLGIVEGKTEAELDKLICQRDTDEVFTEIKQATKQTFEVFQTSSSQDNENGPITFESGQQRSKCPRDGASEQFKFSIPRVYGTVDSLDTSSKEGTDKRAFKKLYTDEENSLGFKPQASVSTEANDHYWIKVSLSMLGSLKEEVFIKTLTLHLNQVIADYLVELHLRDSFSLLPADPTPQATQPQGATSQAYPTTGGFAQTILKVSPERNTSQFKMMTADMRSLVNNLQRQPQPLLNTLFETSLATHSPLASQTKIKLQGDQLLLLRCPQLRSKASEEAKAIESATQLVQNQESALSDHQKEGFVFSMIREMHDFFRRYLSDTNDDAHDDDAILDYVVIIRKIQNQTEQCVSSVLIKLPLDKRDFCADAFNTVFQRHVDRQSTLLKNVRVEVQLLVGSFRMQLSSRLLGMLTPEEAFPSEEPVIEDLTLVDDQILASFQSPMKEPKIVIEDSSSPQSMSRSAARRTSLKQSQAMEKGTNSKPLKEVLNDVKGLPSISVQTKNWARPRPVQVSREEAQQVVRIVAEPEKATLEYPHSFFVRVLIGQSRPNHPKSRPLMTLETFNLSSATADRLFSDVITPNVELCRVESDHHQVSFAKNLGLDFTRPNYFTYLKRAQHAEQLQNALFVSVEKSPKLQDSQRVTNTSVFTASKISESGVADVSVVGGGNVLQSAAGMQMMQFKRQKQMRRSRKNQKVRKTKPAELDSNATMADFNTTAYFKHFYDNFFAKEQALKRLTKFEEATGTDRPGGDNPATMAASNMNSQISAKSSMAIAKKSFSTPV